jgi:predicted Zn-dependent protease
LTLCNPVWRIARTHGRKLVFALGFASGLLTLVPFGTLPAQAQGQPQNNSVYALRDTETEELLRSYEQPLARAAGLDSNAVKTYLMGDLQINAFATQPEDIFIFAGILLWVRTPGELIGVMAHETGHLSAGHLSRGSDAMSKAMIPMLLSLLVGVAVMVAGGGQAGMAIMGIGQSIAQGMMTKFTRVQESAADQIAARLLLATHQSPMGLYHTFQRFADDEARNSFHIDPFAADHPVGQERVGSLQDLVDASPYKDVPDPPQSVRALQMVQAKLSGFILPLDEALRRYPVSDTSAPARYARAMAYMRKPDLQKALAEINSLIRDEPNNPYFYEVLGQIHVMMARPLLGVPAYEMAVKLKPGAPQLRAALATAQLATDNPAMAPAALSNLKAAQLVEPEDPFTWYETAQAYSMMKNQPMADLATAESNYNGGNMRQAFVFASRARRSLNQGSPDWQRANDIIGASAAAAAEQQQGRR